MVIPFGSSDLVPSAGDQLSMLDALSQGMLLKSITLISQCKSLTAVMHETIEQ